MGDASTHEGFGRAAPRGLGELLSVQARCSVVRREGSASGSWTSTLWMFASPDFWETFTFRLAPLALLVFDLV